MVGTLKFAADALIGNAINRGNGPPCVAAVATNRSGNIYEGAGCTTPQSCGSHAPNSVCTIFTNTKPLTGIICLQLVEQGLLDLDAPARDYLPQIAEIIILEGYDKDGTPHLRAPQTEITTRHMLLHSGAPLSPQSPQIFDPHNPSQPTAGCDWARRIVQAITGKAIGILVQQNILDPLEMKNTSFVYNPLPCHTRVPHRNHLSNQGTRYELRSTVIDFAKLVRMWLNDGNGPRGRVLSPDTVNMAETSGLDALSPTFPSGIELHPTIKSALFPDTPRPNPVYSIPANDNAAINALREKYANYHFWVDRKQGVGGIWANQITPYPTAGVMDDYQSFYAAVTASVRRQHKTQLHLSR